MNLEYYTEGTDFEDLEQLHDCINAYDLEIGEEGLVDFITSIFNKHKATMFNFKKTVTEAKKRYNVKLPIKNIKIARKFVNVKRGKYEEQILDADLEYTTGLTTTVQQAEQATLDLIKFCIDNTVFTKNLNTLTAFTHDLANGKRPNIKQFNVQVSAYEDTTAKLLTNLVAMFEKGSRRRIVTRKFSSLYESIDGFNTACDLSLTIEKQYMKYVQPIVEKAKVSEQLVEEIIATLKETKLDKQTVLLIADTVYKLDQIYLAFGDAITRHMALAHSFAFVWLGVTKSLKKIK